MTSTIKCGATRSPELALPPPDTRLNADALRSAECAPYRSIRRAGIRALRQETWFLSRAFRIGADAGLRGVVSFSDPVPRLRADGTLLSPGHVGTIYQAANGWHTAERGTPRTLLVGPDGLVLSDRALSKIRHQERGHEYAERQLVGYGARPLRPGQSPAAWLRDALDAAGIRRVRHPGNYRYLFRIGRPRGDRNRLIFGLPAAAIPQEGECPLRLPVGTARSDSAHATCHGVACREAL